MLTLKLQKRNDPDEIASIKDKMKIKFALAFLEQEVLLSKWKLHCLKTVLVLEKANTFKNLAAKMKM